MVAERRIVAAVDRIVAANPVERAHLAWYYGADVERVRVIPCGVDLDLFQPADPGPPGRASASRRSTSCSSWAGWPRSRAGDAPPRAGGGQGQRARGVRRPAGRGRRRQGRALGRRASGAARAGGRPGGRALGRPGTAAASRAARLLRRRRPLRHALALRVVRHGGARGDGVRGAGHRLAGRRAQGDRPGRRDGPAGTARGRHRGAGGRHRRAASPTASAAGGSAPRRPSAPSASAGRASPGRSSISTASWSPASETPPAALPANPSCRVFDLLVYQPARRSRAALFAGGNEAQAPAGAGMAARSRAIRSAVEGSVESA